MRRSGILVALLALPLYVPVLVFSAGSVAASAQGLDPAGGLLYLAAGLVLALVLAPLATAAALRMAHASGRSRRLHGRRPNLTCVGERSMQQNTAPRQSSRGGAARGSCLRTFAPTSGLTPPPTMKTRTGSWQAKGYKYG